MERVAIIGVGQTVLAARRHDRTFAELVYEATTRALTDAQMGIGEVGNIITASNDFLDGRTISSMAVGDAAGAAFGGGKNIATLEGDGAQAAFYGLARILSGAYESTLVVAHSKPSEGDHHLITNAYFDPVHERALGLDWISAAGLQARACFDKHGWTPELCARVVSVNRKNGRANPYAQVCEEISPERVMASELLAPPIRRADSSPLSDGAAAVILARESAAKKLCKKPVWIEGVGLCAGPRMTDRDLWESPALRAAGQKAFAMAGIKDPGRELDVAELSCEFSYQELLWIRELKLEVMDPRGINPSGGSLCGHTPVAAGLIRMIDAVRQLRGHGPNQVADARLALAHGVHGPAGQSHAVWVMRN